LTDAHGRRKIEASQVTPVERSRHMRRLTFILCGLTGLALSAPALADVEGVESSATPARPVLQWPVEELPDEGLLPGVVVAAEDDPNGTTYTETSAASLRPIVGAGCRSVWAGRYRKSTAGIVVWRYRQIIDWCWNAAHTRITSRYRERWGRTYVPLWHFRGHIGNSTAGGVGYGYYKAFTQGHFEFCFVQIGGCVVSKDPWIRMTTYATGAWSYTTDVSS
jgi:hypothetical protein